MTTAKPGSGRAEDQALDATNIYGHSHGLSRISPPPLRRQRSNVTSDEAKSLATQSQLGSILGEDSRRHSNIEAKKSSFLSTSSGRQSAVEVHVPRTSLPFSSTSSYSGRSANGSVDRRMPSMSAFNGKPKCQVCMKGSSANYDPLITCSGCRRHFHDSCRKPSLVEGADAQQWRCFRCLSEARRSLKTSSTDPPVCRPFGSHSKKRDSGARTAHLATNFRDPVQAAFRPTNPPDITRNIYKSNVALSYRSLERSGGSARSRLSKSPQAMSDHNGMSDNDMHAKTPRLISVSREALDSLQRKRSLQDLLGCPAPGDAVVRHSQFQTFLGRTEIPNTPSQRSSQPKRQVTAVIEGADVPNETYASELGSTPLEPLPKAKPGLNTSLCTVCLKQRILAKPGRTQLICRKCLEQSHNTQHERSEIPETPEPVVHAPNMDPENLSNTKPTPHDGTDGDSTPWFKSGLVSGAFKVKQKKIRQESFNEPTMARQEFVESGSMLCDTAESAGEVAEDVMLGSEHETTHGPTHDVPGSALVQNLVAPGFAGTLSADVCKQPADLDDNIQDDNVRETSRISCSPEHASTVKARQPSPQARHVSAEKHDDSSVQDNAAPKITSRLSGLRTGRSRSQERSPSESSRQTLRALAIQKSYTVRELAQIALVAANGERMMVSDVVSWISSTFPKESLTGAWAKSLQSVFSRFDEFSGDNPDGRKFRYGFSSMKTRRAYEEKFSAFLPPPPPPARSHEQSQRANDQVQRKQRQRAVKMAERSRGLRSKQERMGLDRSVDRSDWSAEDTDDDVRPPKAASPLIHEEPNENPEPYKPEVELNGNDTTFNPFERTGSPPKFWVPQEHNNMHIRLTSFEEVYASPAPPSIDTMTEEEKTRKIAEITARPSRKKYFGQDYKLAHKRRHNLADIHDESDGAWKPPQSAKTAWQMANEKDSDAVKHMEVDEDEPQTLRQLFNLPDNMIPMNDGHTELAFRDGTLVNGRLPRPRNVYRVGKMFGGELTIRSN